MTLNEQFELIDQLLESGDLKIIDDKLYAECEDLDELLEGILSKLANRVSEAKAKKRAKIISDAAINTDENKQDKLDKKAEKVKNKLMKMSKNGKQDKVNNVLTKANTNIKNVTSTANQVSDMTDSAKTAKQALVGAAQKTREVLASNNIKKKENTESNNTGNNSGNNTNTPANGQPVKRKPLGRRRPFAESLTLKMPEDIIIVESNNYNFFLEQVLEYNGFKVNENNIAVLAEALENGHATIE